MNIRKIPIKEIKEKVKIWLRRNYLKYKFKYSSTPIYINSKDRRLGLTTLLMEESIKRDIPILVRSNRQKNNMAYQMYNIMQLKHSNIYSQYYIQNELLLNCNETYRKRCLEVLIDNSLTEKDISCFACNHLGQNTEDSSRRYITSEI